MSADEIEERARDAHQRASVTPSHEDTLEALALISHLAQELRKLREDCGLA